MSADTMSIHPFNAFTVQIELFGAGCFLLISVLFRQYLKTAACIIVSSVRLSSSHVKVCSVIKLSNFLLLISLRPLFSLLV